jgi:hypothetical protein
MSSDNIYHKSAKYHFQVAKQFGGGWIAQWRSHHFIDKT